MTIILGRFLAALWLAALVASPAAAQTDELTDLTFAGGTVTDYVNALRKKNPELNVIVIPSTADVRLPAFELRQVDLNAAIAVLETVFEEQQDRMIALDIAFTPGGVGGNNVYTIRAVERGRRTPPSESIVVAVEDLLAGVEGEELLTAIEAALDLLSADLGTAQIRFHEATGILIARGHPEQMAIISEVVEQVRRNVSLRMQHERQEADTDAKIKSVVSILARENEQLRTELEQAMTLIAQLRGELRAAQGDGAQDG